MSKTQSGYGALAAGALLVVAGAYHLRAARADGAPTATPLYYSGQASEAGAPITGTRNVRVSLWRDATSTDTAMRMCETVALDTAFTEGSFRIALEAACVTAVRDEPNLFVELEIAGTRIGERVALGAVPYALEADHALTATRATDATAGSALALATVPAGAVMAFDLDACPAGWTEYTAAQGRRDDRADPGLAGREPDHHADGVAAAPPHAQQCLRHRHGRRAAPDDRLERSDRYVLVGDGRGPGYVGADRYPRPVGAAPLLPQELTSRTLVPKKSARAGPAALETQGPVESLLKARWSTGRLRVATLPP